jgi:hypothetical protein
MNEQRRDCHLVTYVCLDHVGGSTVVPLFPDEVILVRRLHRAIEFKIAAHGDDCTRPEGFSRHRSLTRLSEQDQADIDLMNVFKGSS